MVSFGAGYPADVHADIPVDVRGKNFGQALEILEKQALRTSMTRRRGRPRPEGCEKNFGQKNFGLKFRSLKSGTKNEPKPRLFSPDILGWGGGLPHEGVGAKKFGMPLETREIKLFWRDIPGLRRDIPKSPEKFEKKKVWVQFSFPIKTTVFSLNSQS